MADTTPLPTTNYSLLSNDKNLRMTGGAVARIDGVIVGTCVGEGTHAISEELLQRVTRILALRCAQLSPKQRPLFFSEVTCSDIVNFHVGMDKEARVFVVAVEKSCPVRLSLLAVEEFAKEWAEGQHGNRSLICVEDGCRFAVREYVMSLARRFEDMGAKDQLTRVQAGVEGVRELMQVNISKALEGLQATEDILVRSEELKSSALVFKKNATTLKKIMWWQKTRYQLLLGGLIILVAVVLGVVLGITLHKK